MRPESNSEPFHPETSAGIPPSSPGIATGGRGSQGQIRQMTNGCLLLKFPGADLGPRKIPRQRTGTSENSSAAIRDLGKFLGATGSVIKRAVGVHCVESQDQFCPAQRPENNRGSLNRPRIHQIPPSRAGANRRSSNVGFEKSLRRCVQNPILSHSIQKLPRESPRARPESRPEAGDPRGRSAR